jgi:hypothetical protein
MTVVYGNVRHARRCITVAAGVAGVVTAHMVAYVLAFADPRQRAHVLASTGHGYWSGAVGVVVLAAAIAAAAAVANGAVRSVGLAAAGSSPVVPRRRALAGWQLAMFTIVEVVERLAAGAPLSELVHGHEFAIGLGLQIVVAALLVAALDAVERLGARVAGRLTPARPKPRRHVERSRSLTGRAPLARADRPAVRGPPGPRTAFA